MVKYLTLKRIKLFFSVCRAVYLTQKTFTSRLNLKVGKHWLIVYYNIYVLFEITFVIIVVPTYIVFRRGTQTARPIRMLSSRFRLFNLFIRLPRGPPRNV